MLLNRNGVILEQGPLHEGMNLGDRDLREAIFTAMVLDGLDLSGAELHGATFSESDLYWLNLFHANCTDASFRGATLEGANFKSSCLLRVDLADARVLRDRLGRPSSFAHADLTDAKLAGAVLTGTEYDANTIWPNGFFPEEHGLVLVQIKDDWLVSSPCKSR